MVIAFVLMGEIVVAQLTASNVKQNKSLVFEDDFSQTQISKNWIVETNEQDTAGFFITDGQLRLDTETGITCWYKNELSGNILIEYDRTVVVNGGKHDRLSDLNQFWMVTDPQNKMFTRKGGFREYDSMQMYYVGMGGNYNTTTRMRRYDGSGNLLIVGEYKDSFHLLVPNKKYHIMIVVNKGESKFIVDGNEYFSFKDDQPFTRGWFAIRSTKSRQLIDNVKIWRLE